MDLTADFGYCRLHGSDELYVRGYDDQTLDAWAARVVAWLRGREPADARRVIHSDVPDKRPRDVHVYFDNDAKVQAPFNSQGLQTKATKLLNT